MPLDLFKLLRRPKPRPPSAPDGVVVYAIGDVHGRLDLFSRMIETIRTDFGSQSRSPKVLVVLLGDYVDRGPASAGVVEEIIGLCKQSGVVVRPLKGNHEDALLNFLRDPPTGETWLQHGGWETLLSYGVEPIAGITDPAEWRALRDAFAARLPREHRLFFERLKPLLVVGDYVFVHAGLRPGVPIDAQDERDLLWIRKDFLDKPWKSDKVVVHGHTPVTEVDLQGSRIGVDTGAYATGVLSAIRLERADRRLIQISSSTPFGREVADPLSSW